MTLLCSGWEVRQTAAVYPPTHSLTLKFIPHIISVHKKTFSLQLVTYFRQTHTQQQQQQRITRIILHLINSSSLCLWNNKHLQSFMSGPRNSESLRADVWIQIVHYFHTEQVKDWYIKDLCLVFLHGYCSFVCFHQLLCTWDNKWPTQHSFIHFALITQKTFGYLRIMIHFPHTSFNYHSSCRVMRSWCNIADRLH